MLAAIALVLAGPVQAQDKELELDKVRALVAGDPEDPSEPSGPADSDLDLKFQLRSEAHAFDNLDLRPLDESTDQRVIDSDDRHVFGYTGISASAAYRVRDGLDVYAGLSHYGLWGEDQLGGQASYGGVLNFSRLGFSYLLQDGEDFSLTLRVGRQPFRIGGVPTDYMLDDVLDAVVLEADLGTAGGLRWLALDYYTANDLPSASFVRYVAGRQPVLGLRGDTYTLRTGVIYENENDAVEGLTVKGYWFYADIGGGPITESGADYSEGGSLGNFSDNDFQNMAGGRTAYRIDMDGSYLNFFGEGAYSWGIDRKELVARDVETVGAALGGGLEANFDPVYLALDYYQFDGATYASDGLEFERGFVGFKGKRVGGLNLNRYAGWSPSAYLGRGGVEHAPNDVDRAGGTATIHGALALEIDPVTVRVDVWHLTDTSESFLSVADIDGIDPPFGYSREEYFAASARSGKVLGTEVDLQLICKAAGELEFFFHGGVFMPGEFYEVEIDKVAGSALGGTETFWAATAGATVDF
jgi:hypothetical protein